MFGKGAIQDTPDSRDFKYSDVASAGQFDWQAGFDIENKLGRKIEPKNQGASGSCGGQSIAYYGAVIEALATGTYEERSAKFPYSQNFIYPSGSRSRDNCALFKNQGLCTEERLTSYENGPPSESFMQRNQDITEEVRKDAIKAKALSYYSINLDIESVAKAIQDGNGCLLTIIGENNGTWLSAFPAAPKKTEWLHAIYTGKARLINGKKYIGLLNSWGNVGEEGWQWIGEDYFPYITQGFTLIYDAQIKHVFNYDMRLGDENEEVKFLQVRLQDLGFFPKQTKCTGFYGNITKKAVISYAMSKMLAVTGNKVGVQIRGFLNC